MILYEYHLFIIYINSLFYHRQTNLSNISPSIYILYKIYLQCLAL